jgi:uncharacterized membrane-anchored protein YitT (DUF2179 family)
MRTSNLNKATSIIGLMVAPLPLAIGINLFIAPHQLAFGGVSGASIVVEGIAGIPLHVTSLVLNLIILLIGWRFKGREFLVKTIIPSLLIPFYIFVTAPLKGLAPDVFASVIFGPVTMGIGIGAVLAFGGSTAGPDTIGEVVEARFGIPAKRTRVAIDATIVATGGVFFGLQTALYSIIVLFLLHEAVDKTRNYLSERMVLRY